MGSSLGWSDLYTFRAIKNGTDWPVRLALFGDMGNENAQSLARLQEETQQGHFDAVFHVGTYSRQSFSGIEITPNSPLVCRTTYLENLVVLRYMW